MEVKKTYRMAYPSNPKGMVPVELDKVHSPLKLLAHEEILRKFVNGEKTHPLHLRIGITNSCNIRCDFCNFHSTNETSFYDCFSFSDKLDTGSVISFLESFAKHGGKAVTFCGAGEPTTHPGYDQICRAARKAGLKIGLITNGTMLSRKEISQCIIDTHTWVRIGLNAGNEKSHRNITHCVEGTFDKILNSVRAIRENAVEPDFRIGLNFVITTKNHAEIIDAATVSRDAFAHYIRFEPEFYTALGHDTIDDVNIEIERKLAEAKSLGSDTFEVSIPKLDRGRMDKTDKIEGDFTTCHYSNLTTALGADGYMYPCPQVHLGSKYRMGKAIDKGYDAWLDGKEKDEWFKKNPDRRNLCKTCFYRPPNELLEWLLKGKLDLGQVVKDYNEDNPATIHADFI